MKNVAQKYPVLLFFFLSYVFSWAVWIPAVFAWRRWFAPDQFPWWFFASYVLGSYGPTWAAIIMAGFLHGSSGIKRLLKKLLVWRAGFQWYLAAIGIPTLGIVMAMGLYVLRGGMLERFDLSQWYLVLFVPLFALPTGAVGEELGWRGYALPALQSRYSALKSSGILGALWALWHAPAYWAPSGTVISGRPVSLTAIVFYMLFTIGVSIIMTWIFNNSNDNVPLAILFHISINAGLPFLFFPDLAPEAMANITYLCIIPIWVIGLFLISFYRAKGLSRQAVTDNETPNMLHNL